MTPALSLTPEILYHLFNFFLDTNSLLAARAVCKDWHYMASSDWMDRWKGRYEKHVSISVVDKTANPVRHKGGWFSRVCQNGATVTCPIQTHLVFPRKAVIPDAKRVTNNFLAALIREKQSPDYLCKMLQNERAKLHEERKQLLQKKRYRHFFASTNSQLMQMKGRRRRFIRSSVFGKSKAHQEYLKIDASLHEKIEELTEMSLVNKIQQSSANATKACQAANSLLNGFVPILRPDPPANASPPAKHQKKMTLKELQATVADLQDKLQSSNPDSFGNPPKDTSI